MDKVMVKKHIQETIDRNHKKYIQIGQQLYNTPETGYKEEKTSFTISESLKSMGLRVEDGLAITGCRAYANEKKKGPKIAVFAELDALICEGHPDSMKDTHAVHACGHNIQLAVMLGVADALVESGVLKYLDGKIDFIAVPAEEAIEFDYREKLKRQGKIRYYCGKTEMLYQGYFRDIDMCLMVHNYPLEQEGYKVVPFIRSNGMIQKQIIFKGKQSHAGQAPWEGINALNMAAIALNNIQYQRETFKDSDMVRIHQIITKGGDIVNCIPEQVTMEMAVRANNIPAMIDANKKVNRSLKAAAIALNGEVEIQDNPGQLPIYANKDLSRLFLENARAYYEDEKILPCMDWSASSDMGDVSVLKPVLHALTSGVKGSLHSKEYQIVNEEDAYIIPVKIICGMIVDLLFQGEGRAENIRNKFQPIMNETEYREYLESVEGKYLFS